MINKKLKEAVSLLHKDKQKSLKLLLDLEDQYPDNWQVSYYLAACFSIQQNYLDAIKSLHKAISLRGENYNLCFNLGYCYRQIGNAAQAHYYLGKSVELSQMQDEASIVVFASILHELGGYKESLSILKKAYQSNLKSKDLIITYLYLFGYYDDILDPHKNLLCFTEEQKNRVVSFGLKHDFFRYNEVDSKIKQAAHINEFAQKYKKSYAPESFILPEEKENFISKYSKSNKFWLMKPDSLSGGAGMKIIGDISDIQGKKCVVQQYIDNPYLLEEKKFNLRAFLVILSVNPLEVYLWKEGLIYIAPEKFSMDKKNLSNKNIHIANMLTSGEKAKVTNYSKFNSSVLRFTELLEIEFGDKAEIVYSNLTDLVLWLCEIIKSQGILAQQNYRCKGSSFMHKFLGLDIIIDKTLNCWLIETERYPGVGAGVFKERSEINMQFINEYWDLILNKNNLVSSKNFTQLKV